MYNLDRHSFCLTTMPNGCANHLGARLLRLLTNITAMNVSAGVVTKTQTSDLRSRKLRPLEMIFKNSFQFLSPKMCYGHAMFIGNSLKGTRYLSSPVSRCHIDQTVNWKPENSDPATSFFSWGLRLRGQRSEFSGPEVSWHSLCSRWSLIRTRKKQTTKQIEDESRCNVKSGRNKR